MCVVGLFGNGRSGVQGKAFYANSAVERNVFQVSLDYVFVFIQYDLRALH